MAKEATVRARLEPHLKADTEKLLHQLAYGQPSHFHFL